MRAPHKPLLLLYALGRLQQTGKTSVSFVEAEAPLQLLLDDYGPAGGSTTPAYPFHHLQTDGLWVVSTADGTDPGSAVGKLRSSGAFGKLAPDFEAALRQDATLIPLVVRTILEENFPESVQLDLCRRVGLDLEVLDLQMSDGLTVEVGVERRRRPAFREEILVAYEYRCAMCGFDGRLGSETIGLDAAHVRWWAFAGPDDLSNGLCLCNLHHKLFDRGAIGVTRDHRVQVSRRFVGRAVSANLLVLDLVGRQLIEPQRGLLPLAGEHLDWHGAQVFRGPARLAA